MTELLVMVQQIVGEKETSSPHLESDLLQLGGHPVLQYQIPLCQALMSSRKVEVPITVALELLVVQAGEPRDLDVLLVTLVQPHRDGPGPPGYHREA